MMIFDNVKFYYSYYYIYISWWLYCGNVCPDWVQVGNIQEQIEIDFVANFPVFSTCVFAKNMETRGNHLYMDDSSPAIFDCQRLSLGLHG